VRNNLPSAATAQTRSRSAHGAGAKKKNGVSSHVIKRSPARGDSQLFLLTCAIPCQTR
jgi:hypothetical protein